MEKIEFLPIGSVINLKGGVKKIMIIARGVVANIGDEKKYFDYGGCLYPEGLTGDSILYFNHTEIIRTVHTGLSDDDDKLMVDNINDWIASLDVSRGTPEDIERLNKKKTGAEA